MIDTILSYVASGGIAGGVVSGLVIWIWRDWIGERLKQSISNEYAQKLEQYKSDIELRFNDQVRLRKVYEELALSLEDIFGTMPDQDPKKMSVLINKLFALLALYAPDEVYQQVKDVFYISGTKTLFASNFRPPVYHALRKSLFGEATKLTPESLVDNLDISPVLKKAEQ